jgi:large subunit ribosomal protein L10
MSEYQTRANQQKIDSVEALKKMFGAAGDYIFTDYRGLTVDQITTLRRRLREMEAEYRVVKNNYARIAFRQMEKPDVTSFFTGPTAVALIKNDSGPVAKALFEFAKDTTVQVKGALIGETVFDAKQAEEYSKLPTREELLASLMGTMKAPLQNFVYGLNGITTKLVRTLQAVADAK